MVKAKILERFFYFSIITTRLHHFKNEKTNVKKKNLNKL